MTPPISVILPFYNSDKYLAEAIESILGQTYVDFELILIDDGSTDQSTKIAESYQDERIRILINEGNRGLVFSLNRGIEVSRGKYIARMDADDISLPERFEKQLAFLETHPNVGVLGTAFQRIDIKGEKKYNIVYGSARPKLTKFDMIWACPVAHPSVMMRRDVILAAGGYDPDFTHAEDYELWSRVILIADICSLPDLLLLYRWGNIEKVSNKYRDIQSDLDIEIRRRCVRLLFNREISYEVSRAFYGVLVKDPSLADDHARIDACRLLRDIYTDAASNLSLPEEVIELREISISRIRIISSQVTSISKMLEIFHFPRYLVSRRWLLAHITSTLKNRLHGNLRKIKRLLFK